MEEKTPEEKKVVEEKTNISTIILIIAIFFGVLTFFMMIGEQFNNMMLASFIIACGLGFIIRPALEMWENSKNRFISFKEKILLATRIPLVVVATQGFYMIFVSPIYDLYWSYWMLLFAFIVLGIVGKAYKSLDEAFDEEEIDEIEEETIEEEEEKGKTWKRMKKLGYILISAALLQYQYYTPPRTLNTEELIQPISITVSLVENQEDPGGFLPFIMTTIMEETEDKELIVPLWKEVQQGAIDNLRYIDSFNYSKMREIYGHHYSVYVAYDGIRRDLEEEGELIDLIYIYPNGRAYLSRYNFNVRNRSNLEIFPITLSEEILRALNIPQPYKSS